MGAKTPHYEEEFKYMVVQQYLNGASKCYLSRKYGIGGKTTILKWMRKFGLSDTKPTAPNTANMPLEESNKELLKRIKELEEALMDEKIKATGYKKMVEIAEQQFKIPIQKKPYTKQSKK